MQPWALGACYTHQPRVCCDNVYFVNETVYVRVSVSVHAHTTRTAAFAQGFRWALASGPPSTPGHPPLQSGWGPPPGSAQMDPFLSAFLGLVALCSSGTLGCTTVVLGVAGGRGAGLLRGHVGVGCSCCPGGGCECGEGEEGGQRGRGLGTRESRKEEQLLTCLSAQLFVSGSPRETEAAGGGKSHPAGPAVLLPLPQVLTPEQDHQREIGRGSPSLSLLRKASLGPIGSSLCANTCDAVRARCSVHVGTAPWWTVPLLWVNTGTNAHQCSWASVCHVPCVSRKSLGAKDARSWACHQLDQAQDICPLWEEDNCPNLAPLSPGPCCLPLRLPQTQAASPTDALSRGA